MTEREEPQSPPNNEPKKDAEGSKMDMRLAGALVRTALSSEQSLLSWVRTSVSLFTFGFSIAQFFSYIGKQPGGDQFSEDPLRLGLALVCVGIFALALGMIEHVQRVRTLQKQGLPRVSRFMLPIGSAGALLVFGIVGLIVSF